MTDNEWFEIKAATFYNMTGFMAPGKDIAAAAGTDENYLAERDAEWRRWSLEYQVILSQIRRTMESLG